ncbi:hypothetical protein BpHYR1_036595 [Brachionus plicatilis]|uniref:Uncharacterized protein n=1 Tax=Brachionus plicatilis TaxID=10195 RepID=A0A3M7T383_BRAPC|nr:hypothetical protein BpHYR1_036595 [Brachionus plicatilis]
MYQLLQFTEHVLVLQNLSFGKFFNSNNLLRFIYENLFSSSIFKNKEKIRLTSRYSQYKALLLYLNKYLICNGLKLAQNTKGHRKKKYSHNIKKDTKGHYLIPYKYDIIVKKSGQTRTFRYSVNEKLKKNSKS